MALDRQLGKTRTKLEADGTVSYVQMFLVDDATLTKYCVAWNSSGHTWLPTGAIVRSWNVVEAGTANSIVTVVSDTGRVSYGKVDALLTIRKTLGEESMVFDKAWFGVKVASIEDVTEKCLPASGGATAVKQGDYVFINATANVRGSANYEAAPFTSATMIAAFGATTGPTFSAMLSAMTTPLVCVKYTVTFPMEASAAGSIYNFRGVVSSVPGQYAPPGFTSGKWRTFGQKMEWISSSKILVTRSMLEAPYVNGTFMSWSDATYGTATW